MFEANSSTNNFDVSTNVKQQPLAYDHQNIKEAQASLCWKFCAGL